MGRCSSRVLGEWREQEWGWRWQEGGFECKEEVHRGQEEEDQPLPKDHEGADQGEEAGVQPHYWMPSLEEELQEEQKIKRK